jgi:hypothetical protein
MVALQLTTLGGSNPAHALITVLYLVVSAPTPAFNIVDIQHSALAKARASAHAWINVV